MSYAELVPYATAGAITFGLFTIPAGWLADRWSREGMMLVIFFGTGICSTLTGFAQSPVEVAICLALLGVFAAIYHPVGLALVVQNVENTGIPLAVNGVFGNLGVASAALLTGFIIQASSWQIAFIIPGAFTILIGLLYSVYLRKRKRKRKRTLTPEESKRVAHQAVESPLSQSMLVRIFVIVLVTTAHATR